MSRWQIIEGSSLDVLRTLPSGSVRCCVTSPPYWGLRDYGNAGQIGLEPTPAEYVARLVDVFREVRRVLTDDGTLWVNLGDSYAATTGTKTNGPQQSRNGRGVVGPRDKHPSAARANLSAYKDFAGLKPKDLVGIPWRVAFALQADGWYLRSDIIWAKPNPMPESVTDRPTKAHEYVFLLSKSARYYFDADAVREPAEVGDRGSSFTSGKTGVAGLGRVSQLPRADAPLRNVRSVWTITPKPFSGAHFATFPPELPERCIKAGSAPGDVVLDVFNGSGTTGAVAVALGRTYVGIEINPDYIAIAETRIREAAEACGGLTAEEAESAGRGQLGLWGAA